MTTLVVWLPIGALCYWAEWWAWNLTFGCRPFRVRNALWLFLIMWFAPLPAIGAITYFFAWLFDAGPMLRQSAKRPMLFEKWAERRREKRLERWTFKPPRRAGSLSRLLNAELFNPCRRHWEKSL